MITLKKSLSAINKGKTTCEDKRIIRIVAMIRLIEELSKMGIHPVITGDMALAQVFHRFYIMSIVMAKRRNLGLQLKVARL